MALLLTLYIQWARALRIFCSLATCLLLLATASSAAITYEILYSFTGPEGANPGAGLFMDSGGNLFGITEQGGNYVEAYCQEFGCGVAFQMRPTAGGGWDYKVLHTFCKLANCADGAQPTGRLISDSAGNLYGVAGVGGNNPPECNGYGCGVVFELSPTPHGEWKYKILYPFNGGPDGSFPLGNLVFDAAGNLYGVTSSGGNANCVLIFLQGGCGVVYKLVPNPQGTRWNHKILYTFSGNDGAGPAAGLVFDAAGNLYGTTESGGKRNYNLCTLTYCGVLFELSPTASGPWKETVLHEFTGHSDGGTPTADLVFDAQGDLFGTSADGGFGDVFEFVPQSGGGWQEKVIGSPGGNVYAAVLIDAAGNLWDTAPNGLVDSGGFVFEYVHNPDDSWTEVVQHLFCTQYLCADGSSSSAGLISDSNGNMYGATYLGGTNNDGVIFELHTGQ